MNHFKDQYNNVCPGVYVWKKFLSEEELSPIVNDLNSRIWDDNNPHIKGITTFSQYKQRLLDSLNMPNAQVPDFNDCIRRKANEGMEPHVDIQNYANPIYINEIDADTNLEKRTINIARYGMIIYFNDNYDGGDICYPEHDFCYKPNAGDLVIHSVLNIHAVKKVKSGHRYTHSSYINDLFYVTKQVYDSIDFPDTGYNSKDPRFFYSLSHGESLNPALRKFQSTYINKDEY